MHLLRDFLADSRKPPKRTSRREKTTIIIRASRSLTKTGLCWEVFSSQTLSRRSKIAQDAPRRAQDAPRRLQDAPRRAQDAPKTPQDAPRRAQDARRRPKTLPRRVYDRFLTVFNRFLVDFPKLKLDVNFKVPSL